MKCFVYKITCLLNNKVYIGITKQPVHKRFAQHKSSAKTIKRRPSKLHGAIRKYGAENFSLEVLAELDSWEKAIEAEKELILQYDSYECGYNLTLGGEGRTQPGSWAKGLNKKTHPSLDKISVKQKGKNNSFFGKTHTEQQKQKWSKERKGPKHPMFGVKRPDLSIRNSKREWTEESRNKMSIKKSKPVKCLETQEVYPSVAAAAKALKMDPKLVSLVARQLKHKTKGKTFVFIKET